MEDTYMFKDRGFSLYTSHSTGILEVKLEARPTCGRCSNLKMSHENLAACKNLAIHSKWNPQDLITWMRVLKDLTWAAVSDRVGLFLIPFNSGGPIGVLIQHNLSVLAPAILTCFELQYFLLVYCGYSRWGSDSVKFSYSRKHSPSITWIWKVPFFFFFFFLSFCLF